MQSQPVIGPSHAGPMRFASSKFLKIETAVLARKPNDNTRVIFDEHAVVWIPGAGGGERDRTDDLLLAKQALSQLSYTPDRIRWWVWMDSNHRPPPYQDGALTN